jgi:hypothetical protein
MADSNGIRSKEEERLLLMIATATTISALAQPLELQHNLHTSTTSMTISIT